MKLTIPMRPISQILGWIFFGYQLLLLPLILVFVNLLLGSPLNQAQLNFAHFAINCILTWAIFHPYLIDCAKLSLANPLRCLRAAGLGMVLYYLGSILMGILTFFLRPDFANVNDANIMDMAQDNYLLMAVGTVLLVPVAEEMLYRGLIFRSLQKRYRIVAYVVSAAVFSAIHVAGYIGMYDGQLLLLCFLQYIPAGLALAWAYEQADSIWAPVLMHMTVNLIGISSMR